MKLWRLLLSLLNCQAIIRMVESESEFLARNEIVLELENAKIIGLPQVSCDSKWLWIRLETSIIFQGRVYVNGRAFDRRCSQQFTQNQSNTVLVKLSILDCANIERKNKTNRKLNNEPAFLVWTNIRVDFHPIFITKTSQVFRAECAEVYGLDYDQQSSGPVNTICAHQIRRTEANKTHDNLQHKSGEIDSPRAFTIGEAISHRWTCSDKYSLRKYAMMLRNCDVISRSKHAVQLIDQTGCTVDETLLTNLSARVPPLRISSSLLSLMNSSTFSNESGRAPNLSAEEIAADVKDESYRLETTAESRVFKFLEESEFRFRCSIMLIPRPTDFATIEVPKCSISKEELRESPDHFSDTFQFINPNREFRDVIETVTMTNWIRVTERFPIRNYDRKFPLPAESLDIEFADSSVDGFRQVSENLIADEKHPQIYIPSKIAFGSEPAESHRTTQFGIIGGMNFTQENMNVSSTSNYCVWRSFNWVLLLWSTASACIWLVILGRKIFYSLTKHNSVDGNSILGARHSYRFPPRESRRQTPYGKKYRHPPSNLVSVTRTSSTSNDDRLRDIGLYSEFRPHLK